MFYFSLRLLNPISGKFPLSIPHLNEPFSNYVSLKNPYLTLPDNKISDTTQTVDSFVQSYLDHFIISRIKTTSKNQIPLIISNNLYGTSPEEIFQVLNELDIKKRLVSI